MARRKKLKKGFKRFVTFILFILLIGGAFYAYKEYFSNDSLKESDKPSEKVKKKKSIFQKETWPKEYKVSLLATGDGLIHNTLAMYAKQSDGTYDFTNYLTEIKDYVKKYDIAYYNQETPFGDSEANYSFYPTFSVPSEYGDAMIDAGFNLVSLASNHSYDKGEAGVLRSLKYWQSKKDVIYNGIADSNDARTNYMIGQKNNITYGMLSYTYGLNGFNLPDGKDYLVSVFDYEKAKKDIETLRNSVDVLIVAMHWGIEYALEPTNDQKEQAKFLADQGVDIVIGNHSHCLEPIEWIGDTLVIYSLGNFISNQIDLYSSIGYKGVVGAFTMVDITKQVNEDKTKEIKLSNLNVDLLYTYKNKEKKYYKVIPFSKINSTYLSDYQSVYETYKNVIQKYDNTINVLPAAN